jgi:DNA-binding MarR family transcriptional regulator
MNDDDPRWLSEDEQFAWRRFVRASSIITRMVDRGLKPHGLSNEDYGILAMLSEATDGQLRFGDLADMLAVPRPFLTYRAQRLEAAGLVERRECPSDARGAYLGVTEAGAARVVEAAPVHVASVRAAIFDHLSEAETQQFGALMSAISDGLDRSTECTEAADADRHDG